MSLPPDGGLEIWLLLVVNFFEAVLGLFLTVLSYHAYRSNDRKPSLRNATLGFGSITLGTATEPAFQLGIVGTHVLASDQNVPLQIAEAALISLGFTLLFLAIYRYGSRSRRQRITVSDIDDEFLG